MRVAYDTPSARRAGGDTRLGADAHGLPKVAAPVQTMRNLAVDAGIDALIAPVRPSYKERYPLTDIQRYVTWTRGDGMLFNPWLRVHQRVGASIMKVARESMTISGTVADRETWAEMRLPSSGDHIVPGALAPVKMDVENDRGRCVEPNVWMLHALTRSSTDRRRRWGGTAQVSTWTGRWVPKEAVPASTSLWCDLRL
ncbi:MAG: hypothetical protein U9N79_06035 [Actinomycetota bacterium]|nr:hypothetical protein [Actinomycetota bacterium]